MDHREFSAAAESLRRDGMRLEEWLRVDAATIEQWESGEQAIPPVRARQLAWLLCQADNDRRLRAASLPECAWSGDAHARFEARLRVLPDTSVRDAIIDFSREVTAHTSACDVCRSNEQWRTEHLENHGPFPMPGFVAVVMSAIGAVPGPLMPAAIGAALIGGVAALRFMFVAIGLLIRFPGVSDALSIMSAGVLAVIAAAAGGAAGGLVITLVRPVFRQLGSLGDYLTGIVVVEAYLFAIFLVAPVAFGEPLLDNPGTWKLMAALAGCVGLAAAFAYRQSERPSRQRASL